MEVLMALLLLLPFSTHITLAKNIFFKKYFFNLTFSPLNGQERENNSPGCICSIFFCVFPLMKPEIGIFNTILQTHPACHCIGFQLAIPREQNKNKLTNSDKNGGDSKRNENGIQHSLFKVIHWNRIMYGVILIISV